MAVAGCTSQAVALQFGRRPGAVFSASRLCSATNIQPRSAPPHNVRSESPRNSSDPSSRQRSRKARVDQSTLRASIIARQRGVTSTTTRCVVAESIGFRTNSTCVSLSATWRALQLTDFARLRLASYFTFQRPTSSYDDGSCRARRAAARSGFRQRGRKVQRTSRRRIGRKRGSLGL
jgi:hypothetical protein